MKKIIKLIFLLTLCFGCTDLEEESFSQISPSNFYLNVDDMNASVVAIHESLNRTINLWDFGMSTLTFMPAPHTLSRVAWRAALANYNVSAGDGVSIPWCWDAWYEGVFRANTAIVNMEARTFEGADEAQRLDLIAEAKFMRAYIYFNLVQLWGPVPMPLAPATDVESAKLAGSSIDVIYNQIITDLIDAEANLSTAPRTGINKGRPFVGTAKFLLAKVYLTMAGNPLNDASKYTMAHQKIKEVIDNAGAYGYALNDSYENAIREELNPEIIFVIQQTGAEPDQGTAMAFVWGGPNWPSDRGPFGGQYHAGFSKDFYDSYEETDVRRDVTMAYTYVGANGDIMIYGEESIDGNGDGNIAGWWGTGYDVDQAAGIAPNKYHDGDQDCCNGDPDILIYRYADALLMYAELENELNGPNAVAFEYLNMVRDRANASLIPVGGTKDEFRDLIYKERFWELSFENHEVYDIRRLGKVADAISKNPEAGKIGATYKPHYELFPFPQKELDANSNLEQNPGW